MKAIPLTSLGLVSLPPDASSARIASGPEVHDILAPIVAHQKIAGLAAIALHGDKIVAQGVAGVRQLGAPEPLTIADPFHLGSNTKAMTATLVAIAIDEGKISWDSTLDRIFGDLDESLDPAWQSVTIRQVLAHRAGLTANEGFIRHLLLRLDSAPPAEQRRKLTARVLSKKPAQPPGTFVYSNVGFMLAAAAVERFYGRSWEELMRERLFAPLGITSGGFGPPQPPAAHEPPWGHHANGKPVDPTARSADNPVIYGPAGAAHMTIADWSKFIGLHLRGHPANPNRVTNLVSAASFTPLHTPANGENYAGGWYVLTRSWAKGTRATDSGQVISHAGSNTMWFCVAWVAPEIDFAVIIASNQGGDEAAKACDAAAGAMIKIFGRTGGAH